MLAAMGYQQGQGLGKGQAGRSTPVSVQMKAGRHGLGVQENKKRRQQQIEQQQEERGRAGFGDCMQLMPARSVGKHFVHAFMTSVQMLHAIYCI